MWGQVWIFKVVFYNNRIIPTRVGTSALSLKIYPFVKDHPHACGDKEGVYGSVSATVGSSPRVWGQAISVKISPQMAGIIPTRVGTRQNWKKKTTLKKDHPHACGDKKSNFNSLQIFLGSSPRVWGQDFNLLYAQNFFRIIPTRVGTRYRR